MRAPEKGRSAAPAIVLALGMGHENAVTRIELAARLHASDRQVRRMIELARQDSWLIMNDGDGAGYYLANDLNALKRHYKVERSRALNTLRNLKTTRKVLQEAGMEV